MVSGRVQKSTSPGAKSQPSCTVHVNQVFNTEPGGERCLYWKGHGGLRGEVAFESGLESPLECGQLYKRNNTSTASETKEKVSVWRAKKAMWTRKESQESGLTTLSWRSDTQLLLL